MHVWFPLETQTSPSKHALLLVWKLRAHLGLLQHRCQIMLFSLLLSFSLCWWQTAALNLTEVVTETPKCAVRKSTSISVRFGSDWIYSFHVCFRTFLRLLSSTCRLFRMRSAQIPHDYLIFLYACKSRAHGQSKSILLELRACYVRAFQRNPDRTASLLSPQFLRGSHFQWSA